MNLRVSLVLMILFIGLGYLAFFEPLRTQEKDDLKHEMENHVVWLKDSKIEYVTITNEKSVTAIDCAQPAKDCPFDNSGQWNLVHPEKTGADPASVGTLVSTILNLTHNGKLDFDKGFDEKEFGLDHPQVRLDLKLKGQEQPIAFKFGSATPTGPNLYLSVSSDPHHLFMVPNYLPGMLNQDVFHWRNKRLFPGAESTAVAKIEFHSKKIPLLQAFRLGDQWRLNQPRAVLASKIMFEGLGSTLSYAVAKSIYSPSRKSPEAKKILSTKPALEISFGLNGGAGHEIKLYPKPGANPDSKVMLAVVDKDDTVYTVDAATFDRFEKDLLEYRPRTMIDDSIRSQVDEIRLNFPREKHETFLKMTGANWTITSGDKPGNLMISQTRINGFLDALRNDDFRSMVPLKGNSKEAAAYRKETPDLYFELKSGGKMIYEAKILVFDRKLALTESEGDVRILSEAFLKFLPVRLTDLTEAMNQTVVTESPTSGVKGK